MKAVNYRIDFQQPVLATGSTGDPNSAVSFDFLPGSVLRGALIDRFREQRGATSIDPTSPAIRSLFFDGSSRFLNGYPAEPAGERSLPVPLSLHVPKGAAPEGPPPEITDFAIDDPTLDPGRPPEQWLALGDPFCRPEGAEWRDPPGLFLFKPAHHLQVHTTRTRRFGRAMPADHPTIRLGPDEMPGAVFRYDALAARQTFVAAILCDDDQDADTLLPLLTGDYWIGRSQSADYGWVKLSDALVTDVREGAWTETGDPAPDSPTSLIVDCLSDVILRDGQGQAAVDPAAFQAHLARQLGVQLAFRRGFLRGLLTGGVNQAWQLPLAQAVAFQMGSVLIFDAVGTPPTAAALTALEWHGIGARRAEGFGRIAFSRWHEAIWTGLEPRIFPEVTEPDPARPLSAAAAALSGRMADHRLRSVWDDRFPAEALAYRVESPPERSQIARLRGILRSELLKTGEPPDPGRVLAYLGRPGPRRRLDQAKVAGVPLGQWLAAALDQPVGTFAHERLGYNPGDAGVVLAGVAAEPSPALMEKYRFLFIDRILALAAKAGSPAGERSDATGEEE